MSWSKCTIKDGAATGTRQMPANLTPLGVVKDKSTSVEATDGEELKGVASGGIQVAYEQLEGGFQLTTRIMEPSNELYAKYGLGDISEDDVNVKTHVVAEMRAVEVSPKNVGGKGIKAPYCIVKFKPGRSEEEGEFVDVTYVILPVLNDDFEVDMWYTRFTKKAPLTVTPKSLSFASAADTTGKPITATSTGTVTAESSQSWATVTVTAKVATVKVTANTGAERTAVVNLTADGKSAGVMVTQAGV